MAKYRKKPVVIEAYQLPAYDADDDAFDDFQKWCIETGLDKQDIESSYDQCLLIHTPEGAMEAKPEDWIIMGVAGEFYPCKPDIFAKTYEPA